MNKVYDARGQLCPRPLMMAKQALGEAAEGETFLLLVNDDMSKENVERFLIDNQIPYQCQRDESDYMFTIKKSGDIQMEATATAFRPTTFTADWVVLLKAPTMGQGPEELGKLLLQGFLNTVAEKRPVPGRIILYNSAIQLTFEGSPLLGTLQKLEKLGTIVVVCGTCVDYFKAKAKMKVGQISNMHDILEVLLEASRVIEP